MAADANSSSSPRHARENNIGSPNPRSRRSTASPWNQIVRGGESETIAAVSAFADSFSPQSRSAIEQTASASGSDSPAPSASTSPPAEEDKSENCGGGTHGSTGKKPAWNLLSNGAVEVGPVMGAASWPALSETTKTPTNKSSSDSLKSSSDGSSSSSVPISQGTGAASVSTEKHGNNANSNSIQNYSRQKSYNKRNGIASAANGSLTHLSPHGSVAELPVSSPSSRGHNQRNGFVSQSHGGNDNQQQRNSFRNQNGNHHQNFGGRRNQDHGYHHRSHHRDFNGRDGHIQSHRVTGFMRHQAPLISPQYIPAQPVQPFGNPVGYPEMASPIYYAPPPVLRAVPFVAPMPAPVFYQFQDLHTRLVNQIDFYFSDHNLIRDLFLRKNMDEQGYVQIQLIAGFKKVSELTDNIPLILDALQSSMVVEVQGDKIRRRDNWQKWLIPSTVQLPTSSPRSRERSAQNVLSAEVQNLLIEQNATDRGGSSHQGDVQPQASTNRSSSGDLRQLGDDADGQVSKSVGSSVPPNAN